jgi:hypothetical protein
MCTVRCEQRECIAQKPVVVGAKQAVQLLCGVEAHVGKALRYVAYLPRGEPSGVLHTYQASGREYTCAHVQPLVHPRRSDRTTQPMQIDVD